MPTEHRTRIKVSPDGDVEIDLKGFDADEVEKAIGVLQDRGIIPQNPLSPLKTTDYRNATSGVGSADESTLKERFQRFLKINFHNRWFDSAEVKRVFDDEFADSIRPSTVSTYLSRFADDGFLERKGKRNQRRYRLILKTATAGVLDNGQEERTA
jgi:hypothetical protein